MELTSLGEYGLGVVAIIGIYLIVKMFLSTSNKVVADNTKAINRLASTLEKTSLMEEQFRKDVLDLSRDTNTKVTVIHEKVTQ